MARIARIILPGVPHHVTQRGNRRQPTFFCDGDYHYYKHILANQCARFGVQVWAYALMNNHVHLILVPDSESALRNTLSETHRWYTRAINGRNGWKGCLWQGRFFSTPLDERYLLAASRYVELNPVRAEIVSKADLYPWSSAAAHLNKQDDGLVTIEPLLQRVRDWAAFIEQDEPNDILDLLRKRTRTGRPAGDEHFYDDIKVTTGRDLTTSRPGPKLVAPHP